MEKMSGFTPFQSASNEPHRGPEIFTCSSADIESRSNYWHEFQQGFLREITREETNVENIGECNDFLSCSDSSDDEAISWRAIVSGNDSERESTPFYFSVYDGDTDESNPDLSAYGSETDENDPNLTAFSTSVRYETTFQTVEDHEPSYPSPADDTTSQEIAHGRIIQGINFINHYCESETYASHDESFISCNESERISQYNERLGSNDEYENDPGIRYQRTFHALTDSVDPVISREEGHITTEGHSGTEGASNELLHTTDLTQDDCNSLRSDTEEEAYSVYSDDSSSILESVYESDVSEEYTANVYDSIEEGESENEDVSSQDNASYLSNGESGYQDVMSPGETDREGVTAEDHRPFNVYDRYYSIIDTEREEHDDMTIEDEEVAKLTERLVLEEKKTEENRPGSEDCGSSSRETFLQEALETVVQENEKYRLSQTCKVCLNQEIQIVFVPCGHLATCFQCSHNLYSCPLCRRGILNRIRVYKS